jgi:hypothetical protein
VVAVIIARQKMTVPVGEYTTAADETVGAVGVNDAVYGVPIGNPSVSLTPVTVTV